MVGSNSTSVRVIPLGGLGEIGLNLMVLECGESAVVIDAGVLFPEEPVLGAGLLIPELQYLAKSHSRIEGVVLTHAHEDHIGALPFLLRRFPSPVYGSEVTLAFARRALAEDGSLGAAEMNEIKPGRRFSLGPFEFEPIRVTHSTPDSLALAIRSPAGLIVHTGDFKIDAAPVDGQRFDTARFAQLGIEGVDLLLSDSTNVERPGWSGSESSLKPVLRELLAGTRGKFFLSSFSSHLHRIKQLTELALEMGRYVVPLGRRMAEAVRLGMEVGELSFPPGTYIDRDEAEFIESRRLCFLASGSQGEPMSALSKLAAGNHPGVQIGRDDVVVLSSRFIPGNERTINQVVNQLYKRGAEVIYEAIAPVHVSGHGCRDELAEMIRLVRPRYFAPIHGEYRHLSLHIALAAESGVPSHNCFLLEDGDSLLMSGGQVRRGASVVAGRVAAEGAFDGPELLHERRLLAHDGTVIAILAVSSRTGRIVAGPELLSRGVVVGDGASAHIANARAELAHRIHELNGSLRGDDARLKEEMVRALRRYFGSATGKRPLIVPHIMEV